MRARNSSVVTTFLSNTLLFIQPHKQKSIKVRSGDSNSCLSVPVSIWTVFLTLTDVITSRNTDRSFWITLYNRQLENGKGLNRTYARHDNKWKEQTDVKTPPILNLDTWCRSASRPGCIYSGKKLEQQLNMGLREAALDKLQKVVFCVQSPSFVSDFFVRTVQWQQFELWQ